MVSSECVFFFRFLKFIPTASIIAIAYPLLSPPIVFSPPSMSWAYLSQFSTKLIFTGEFFIHSSKSLKAISHSWQFVRTVTTSFSSRSRLIVGFTQSVVNYTACINKQTHTFAEPKTTTTTTTSSS